MRGGDECQRHAHATLVDSHGFNHVHHFSPSGTCPRSAMRGSIQAYAQFKGVLAMGRARGVPVRRGDTHVKQHDEGNEEEAEDEHCRRATVHRGPQTSAAGELADRRAAERASARSHGRLERASANRKGTRGHSGAWELQSGRPMYIAKPGDSSV